VTTPTAKFTRKILPQKRARFLYSSLPLHTYIVSMMAINTDNPNVRGTKRK